MRCRLIVKNVEPTPTPGVFLVNFRDLNDPSIDPALAFSRLPQVGTITRICDTQEASQFVPGAEFYLDITAVPDPVANPAAVSK